MTQANKILLRSQLGIRGTLARWMTPIEERGSVRFGDYAGRISIFAGLMAMLTIVIVGAVALSVGPDLFASAGAPSEVLDMIPQAFTSLIYFCVAIAAAGSSLIAGLGYFAEWQGFRADRVYDLR